MESFSEYLFSSFEKSSPGLCGKTCKLLFKQLCQLIFSSPDQFLNWVFVSGKKKRNTYGGPLYLCSISWLKESPELLFLAIWGLWKKNAWKSSRKHVCLNVLFGRQNLYWREGKKFFKYIPNYLPLVGWRKEKYIFMIFG